MLFVGVDWSEAHHDVCLVDQHGRVLARYARNKRLANACQRWAFSAISSSPHARAYYDAQRTKGNGHHQALRSLANRLVGILHGCLKHRQTYQSRTAWPISQETAA